MKKEVIFGLTLAIFFLSLFQVGITFSPSNYHFDIPKIAISTSWEDIPKDHMTLMRDVKVYYPWKNLTKQCVFVCQEDINGVICPKSFWLCVWEDAVNVDVACTLTVTSRPDGGYGIEIGRNDGGNTALEFCIEIKGFQWYPFKQEPNAENIGYAVWLYYKTSSRS